MNTPSCMPDMAIIDPNVFTRSGLKELLHSLAPKVQVRTFATFEAFMDDTPDLYVHYFLSAQIYVAYNHFFQSRKHRIILLTNGSSQQTQFSNMHTLNLHGDKKEVMQSLFHLLQEGHTKHSRATLPDGSSPAGAPLPLQSPPNLTPREIEVLVLVTQGLLNKEIAERLHISTTTVISHRKNITRKLGFKSVSALTIYAVLQGYIDTDRI